jgi:hypothetical protein
MKCLEHEFEYDPECEECITEYRWMNNSTDSDEQIVSILTEPWQAL